MLDRYRIKYKHWLKWKSNNKNISSPFVLRQVVGNVSLPQNDPDSLHKYTQICSTIDHFKSIRRKTKKPNRFNI